MTILNVIVEKPHNFVVAFTKHIEELEEEGGFIDLEDDVAYANQDYTVYKDVEVPIGVSPYQYIYTPEKGFIQVISNYEWSMLKKIDLEATLNLELANYEAQSLYSQFKSESSSLYTDLKTLTENGIVNEESILLLQQAVVNLYENLLEQQTLLTSVEIEGEKENA